MSRLVRNIIFIMLMSVIVFTGIFLYELRMEESHEMLDRGWIVKKIYKGSRDITNNYDVNIIGFREDTFRGTLSHPKLIGRVVPYDKIGVYPTWEYYRKDYFNGVYIFRNTFSGLDGEYDIEVLQKRNPKIIKLISDTVTIICVDEYYDNYW